MNLNTICLWMFLPFLICLSTLESAPIVSSISPPEASSGTPITINGNGFLGGTTTVSFIPLNAPTPLPVSGPYSPKTAIPFNITATSLDVVVPFDVPGVVRVQVTVDAIDSTSNPPNDLLTRTGNWTAYVTSNGTTPGVTPIGTPSSVLIPTSGIDPFGIAITPDGRVAYVTNIDTSTIDFIDLTTNPPTPYPSGVLPGPFSFDSPVSIAINPQGTRAYVLNGDISNNNTVTVIDIDPSSLNYNTAVGQSAALGTSDSSIILSPNGLQAYVSLGASSGIAVLSVASDTPILVNTITTTSQISNMAITPDGNFLYGIASSTNQVMQIDLTNSNVTPITVGSSPFGIAIGVNPTNSLLYAYVTNAFSNTVSRIPIPGIAVDMTIPVGQVPSGITITPDGNFAYVVNTDDDNVSIVNLATFAATTITVADRPVEIAITPDQAGLANFTATPAAANYPSSFQALTTSGPVGGGLSYFWDFGDGTTTGPSPGPVPITHTYIAPGPYTVTLIVATAAGTPVIASNGTFTTDIFTGQTLSRNGDVLDSNSQFIFTIQQNINIPPTPPPTVTSVIPNQGPSAGGTTVTITGTNFFNVSIVNFGGTPATSFTVINGTTIQAVSPPGAPVTTVDVTVTTATGTSPINPGDQFTYIAPSPTVTSVTPNQGPSAGGTGVTIAGTNFFNVSGVFFGGVSATSFTVINNTTIQAVSPPGAPATTVDVTVTTATGTSPTNPGDLFTYLAPSPTVTSVTPNQGPAAGGTGVTITGTNFFNVLGVSFGGVSATSFTVINNTTIQAVSPPGAPAATVDVTVITATGTSPSNPGDQFSYLAVSPTVTSITPNSGPTSGGNLVTIIGTNLNSPSTVFFGSQSAFFTINPDGSITAVAPPGIPGEVFVTVVTPFGTTNPILYTYILVPPPPPPLPPILPPSHLRGIQLVNQFATQTERTNVLTWAPPPSGEFAVAYRIYRDASLNQLLGTISEFDQLEFEEHYLHKRTYTYYIVSVDATGRISKPVSVTIRPQ